jgi:chloramphenicol 3-O phosphotransferase
MAASQAEVVHQGVVYDVEVDTSSSSPMQSAQTVLEVVNGS